MAVRTNDVRWRTNDVRWRTNDVRWRTNDVRWREHGVLHFAEIKEMQMIEVRFHGRGGQGAVVSSRVLANAFVREGKFGSAFPMFGFERRGAPVTAYGRFDEKPILEKTQIYEPDCLIVLDPSQGETPRVYEGLKANGVLILNSPKELPARPHPNLTVAGVTDANRIAMEEIGMAAPNICMLGSFAATTSWIRLDSILASLEDYFQGKNLEGNRRCAERGFKETRILRF